MRLAIRECSNIISDLNRGWSSWNFGQWGFEGTRNELNSVFNASTKDQPLFISGFNIYKNDGNQYEFGEFKPNYWVLKDTRDKEGICCYIGDWKKFKDAVNYIHYLEFLFCNGGFCEGDIMPITSYIGDKVSPQEVIDVVHVKEKVHRDGTHWYVILLK